MIRTLFCSNGILDTESHYVNQREIVSKINSTQTMGICGWVSAKTTGKKCTHPKRKLRPWFFSAQLPILLQGLLDNWALKQRVTKKANWHATFLLPSRSREYTQSQTHETPYAKTAYVTRRRIYRETRHFSTQLDRLISSREWKKVFLFSYPALIRTTGKPPLFFAAPLQIY